MKQFYKLTEDVKLALSKMFEGEEFKGLVSKIKDASAEDTGTFEVVISTDFVDRQGESIDQNGWDLTYYKLNPVVLWAHNYSDLPIGVCDEIAIQEGKLVAKGRFAPTPFAQEVRRLYDAKIIRATSVGFIAKTIDGNVITESELLEFSFVPVPANPEALSLVKEFDFDLEVCRAKGFVVEKDSDEEEKPKEDEKPQEENAKAPDDELSQNIGSILSKAQGEIDNVLIQASKDILGAVGGEEGDPQEEGDKSQKEKTGRVISEKNRTAIKTAIDSMKSSIAALEDLLKATDPQSDEDAKSEAKSRGAEFQKADFEKFMLMKEVLRQLNIETADCLAKIKK